MMGSVEKRISAEHPARPIKVLAINQGDPYAMGESIGVGGDHGHARAGALGNVCLWCDEFFTRHFDMATLAPRTGRADDPADPDTSAPARRSPLKVLP